MTEHEHPLTTLHRHRQSHLATAESDAYSAQEAPRLERACAFYTDMQLHYASTIGLLCELSVKITDKELQEGIDRAVADWCEQSGWTWRRLLDRVEVTPP